MPLTRRGASLAALCGPGRTVFSPRMLTTEALAFWAALTMGVNRWLEASARRGRLKTMPAQASTATRHAAVGDVFRACQSSMVVLSRKGLTSRNTFPKSDRQKRGLDGQPYHRNRLPRLPESAHVLLTIASLGAICRPGANRRPCRRQETGRWPASVAAGLPWAAARQKAVQTLPARRPGASARGGIAGSPKRREPAAERQTPVPLPVRATAPRRRTSGSTVPNSNSPPARRPAGKQSCRRQPLSSLSSARPYAPSISEGAVPFSWNENWDSPRLIRPVLR